MAQLFYGGFTAPIGRGMQSARPLRERPGRRVQLRPHQIRQAAKGRKPRTGQPLRRGRYAVPAKGVIHQKAPFGRACNHIGGLQKPMACLETDAGTTNGTTHIAILRYTIREEDISDQQIQKLVQFINQRWQDVGLNYE